MKHTKLLKKHTKIKNTKNNNNQNKNKNSESRNCGTTTVQPPTTPYLLVTSLPQISDPTTTLSWLGNSPTPLAISRRKNHYKKVNSANNSSTGEFCMQKKKQRRVLREIQAYSQLVHIISVHQFLKNEKKMILRAKLREEFSRQKMKFCKRKNTIFGKAEQTTFHFSLQHRGRPLYLTPL